MASKISERFWEAFGYRPGGELGGLTRSSQENSRGARRQLLDLARISRAETGSADTYYGHRCRSLGAAYFEGQLGAESRTDRGQESSHYTVTAIHYTMCGQVFGTWACCVHMNES